MSLKIFTIYFQIILRETSKDFPFVLCQNSEAYMILLVKLWPLPKISEIPLRLKNKPQGVRWTNKKLQNPKKMTVNHVNPFPILLLFPRQQSDYLLTDPKSKSSDPLHKKIPIFSNFLISIMGCSEKYCDTSLKISL